RPDHGDGGVSQDQSSPDRRRHRRQPHQHLPLRHLRAPPPRGASRCRSDAHVRREGTTMTERTLSRRRFVTTALTAAGGFALGVGICGRAEEASLNVRPWGDEAKRYPGEINAWVVIEPDDTVIIRYGRAEMGQGSFTALPQILTEELECDWAFVKPEYASANR